MKVIKFFALLLTYLVAGLIVFCILAMIIAQGIRWCKPYTDYSNGIVSNKFNFVVLVNNGNDVTTERFYLDNRCGSAKKYYDVGLTNNGVRYLSASREEYFSSRQDSAGAMIVSLHLGNDYYEYSVRDNCVTPLREKVFDDRDGFLAGILSFFVLLIFGSLRSLLKLRIKKVKNAENDSLS